MPKLTYDQALEAIADGRHVTAADVRARDHLRKVWIAEWHIPGCMPEAIDYTDTKGNAVAIALEMCGHVRGAASDLRKYGRTDRVSPDAYVSMAITTVECVPLINILN